MKWSRVEHSFIKWPREYFFMEFRPSSTFTFMFWPGLEVSCLQNGHSIQGKLENGHCAEPSARSGAPIGCLELFLGWRYGGGHALARPRHGNCQETQLRPMRRTTVGVCLQNQRQEAFPHHKEQQRTVCCSLARLHLHLQGKYQTPQRWAVPRREVSPSLMQVHLPNNQNRVGAREVGKVLMKTQKMDSKNLTTTLKDEDGVVVAKSTAYFVFCSATKSIAIEGDIRSIVQSFGNARVSKRWDRHLTSCEQRAVPKGVRLPWFSSAGVPVLAESPCR